jgi:hypothetical protein
MISRETKLFSIDALAEAEARQRSLGTLSRFFGKWSVSERDDGHERVIRGSRMLPNMTPMQFNSVDFIARQPLRSLGGLLPIAYPGRPTEFVIIERFMQGPQSTEAPFVTTYEFDSEGLKVNQRLAGPEHEIFAAEFPNFGITERPPKDQWSYLANLATIPMPGFADVAMTEFKKTAHEHGVWWR